MFQITISKIWQQLTLFKIPWKDLALKVHLKDRFLNTIQHKIAPNDIGLRFDILERFQESRKTNQGLKHNGKTHSKIGRVNEP